MVTLSKKRSSRGKVWAPGFQAEQTAKVGPRGRNTLGFWLLAFQAQKEVFCNMSKKQKRGSKKHTGGQGPITKGPVDHGNGFSFCSNLNANW